MFKSYQNFILISHLWHFKAFSVLKLKRQRITLCSALFLLACMQTSEADLILKGYYCVTDTAVFYQISNYPPLLLASADLATFQQAGEIAFDKNTVFIDGIAREALQNIDEWSIYGADVASLQILEMAYTSDPSLSHSHYFKDRDRVYFGQKQLPEADAETFEILGMGYARDQQRFYFYNTILQLPSPVYDVKVIGELLVTASQVYIGHKLVKDMDASSVELVASFIPDKDQNQWGLNAYIVKDKNALYRVSDFDVIKIPSQHIDLGNFKSIGDNFFTDKNGTYTLVSRHRMQPSDVAVPFEYDVLICKKL